MWAVEKVIGGTVDSMEPTHIQYGNKETGEIERIEYDPNRSCYIMLVKFEDGEKFYYLAPQNVKAGDKIIDMLKELK